MGGVHHTAPIMTNTINSYIIHAISEGKPHTATIDHYSRGEAIYLFHINSPFTDTVIQSIEELGPIA